MSSPYTFKIARSENEFDQIFRLNYRTFVDEIPQHETNVTEKLVDKFHVENTYLICLKEGVLNGMMALRDRRPFSLDGKLPDLDIHLPQHQNKVEIRLLSVVPSARTGRVLKGLLALLVEHNRSKNWDLAVISGTTRQHKMYSRLGFKSFGPLVGSEGAYYQPMYVELDVFQNRTRKILPEQTEPHNFLPGPVNISPRAKKAFGEPPISHRSAEFRRLLQSCEVKLCGLTGARKAVIALGTGTLANEMVAAQLSRRKQKGIILANGEFGERLAVHGQRLGLEFDVMKLSWGDPFQLPEIEAAINLTHKWIWMTACETSTGMKNDIYGVGDLCGKRDLKLCVDGVSAVGAYSLDLENIYMATGSSGKALAGYPGLALVFHNHEIEACEKLPVYLDLGYYYKKGKVPFTHSSNLLSALAAALEEFENPDQKYSRTAENAALLRSRLKKGGIPVLIDESHSSPAVFTIPLPDHVKSAELAGRMEKCGIKIASESEYLVARNWIQVCLMGDISLAGLEVLAKSLENSIV